jgi:NADP-dependent aldehyde dehydrogenase
MVLWQRGEGDGAFVATLAQQLGGATAGPTVHPSIKSGYEAAFAELGKLPVQITARGAAGQSATGVCPTLLSASASAVLANPRLRTEIYGPAVLTVGCELRTELLQLAGSLHGHLTATVHGDGDDFTEFADVIAVLRTKVGRLLANGVPTGVEVCGAMVHGGPYPAATEARFSAVGPTAIQRWARPVCWQDWPHALLPAELQDHNPLGIRRTLDGVVA